jgi:hypothetical protein
LVTFHRRNPHPEAEIGGEDRYTENEFALILRKAFELQEGQAGVDTSHGLSLEEIQAVAAEIGLDPALVERAASLLPRTKTSRLARVFGGPSTYQLEYSAAGEISKDEFGKVVDAIRRAAGHQGQVNEVLGSLEWNTVGELSQIHVTVSPRDGQTAIRVFADRGPAGALTFIFPGLAGLISIGIAGAITEPGTALGVVTLVTAAMSGAFLTARTIWKTTTSRFRPRLLNIMQAVSGTVEHSLENSPHERDDSDVTS